MKKINVWHILFLILLSVTLFGSTVTREFEKKIAFKPGGEIVVKNTNGFISVEGWDEESVEIYAEIEVKASSRSEAKSFMNRVEIIVDQSKDQLVIESDHPRIRNSGGFLNWTFGRKPQLKIEYHLMVPLKTDVELSSVNGHIEISKIQGESHLRTTNGHIETEELYGSVDAQTTNGKIVAELLEINHNEEMSFRTTNGSIKLYLPANVQADLEASTVNGKITTDFPLKIQGRYNKKRVSGRINNGGGLIKVRTTNGSIQLYED